MSAPLLAIENASKRFAGLLAVSSVSLELHRGEIIAIIGPNGAGKTTLFNLITGQLAPSEGHVRYKGEPINALPPHARAKRGIGRTFQIAKPFTTLTVLENAMVGAFLKHSGHDEAAAKAHQVLTEVGLDRRADLVASEITLSERRRLEVARALALEPDLILLDEVMAGLNQTEVAQSIELVQRLNQGGISFLVIEHNLKVVRAFSRRVAVLDHGVKIAEGTADEVLNDADVVKAYLGRRHARA